MYQLLFKNRFNALVFVAIILFSVRILVGAEGEEGALQSATSVIDRPSGQSAEMAQASDYSPPQAQPRPRPEEVVMGFTPDEELIDDAQGFDPAGFSAQSIVGEDAQPIGEFDPGADF